MLLNNTTDKRIGKFLKALRQDAQLKQEGMAVKLGVSRQRITRIETGASVVGLAEAVSYFEALGWEVCITRAEQKMSLGDELRQC